jgi:acyl-coenzyme A thioesterase PaaI-like protein
VTRGGLDRRHIVGELGMAISVSGESLHGRAEVTPEMHVPGTTVLRASILAAFTDLLAGLLSGRVIGPRVPVTLDLALELYRPPADLAHIEGVGRPVKVGRTVFVAGVEFTGVDQHGDGAPLGTATATFMPVPDDSLRLPESALLLERTQDETMRLEQPFADRAGCVRQGPGVALLVRSDDGLNSSNTINGGLIALAVEEAVLSGAPDTTLASLAMRYLRPARVGPLVATATTEGAVARVDVRDSGSDDRLTTTATTRTFG